MALMHHNGLRVNAEVGEGTVEIWREQGWASGLHKDTDPDDDSAVPRVLPPVEDEPEGPPTKARKATAKKG